LVDLFEWYGMHDVVTYAVLPTFVRSHWSSTVVSVTGSETNTYRRTTVLAMALSVSDEKQVTKYDNVCFTATSLRSANERFLVVVLGWPFLLGRSVCGSGRITRRIEH
jgi:hypothetical protein